MKPRVPPLTVKVRALAPVPASLKMFVPPTTRVPPVSVPVLFESLSCPVMVSGLVALTVAEPVEKSAMLTESFAASFRVPLEIARVSIPVRPTVAAAGRLIPTPLVALNVTD